ncbi:MAG TPA: hypothetical protein VFC78_00905 [Tepidisphaeraceae bacterium]|nr:hypothetical protein [Tepidisphaeraceae bacterium]
MAFSAVKHEIQNKSKWRKQKTTALPDFCARSLLDSFEDIPKNLIGTPGFFARSKERTARNEHE